MGSGGKMGEDCGGSRKWKEKLENMYWSHFQTIQFFQTLTGDYHQQLAIPEKFVKNLKDKLAEDVILRGPSAKSDEWIVGITTYNNNWYFKNGWKEFVEDHSLQENDVLIFKYSGNSMFNVVMFDNKSLCEKESTYFVEKCVNDQAAMVKDEVRKDYTRSAGQPIEGDANKNVKAEVIGNEERKGEEEMKFPPVVVEISDESSSDDEGYASKKDDIGTTSGGQPTQANAKKGSGAPKGFVSRRRTVTEEGKQKFLKVLDGAKKHARKFEASFLTALLPSHLDGRAKLTIPIKWAREHLNCRGSHYNTVILQVEDKKWKLGLCKREDGHIGISRGLRTFLQENNLEEFDAIELKLVAEKEDIITFDVGIFRAAAENNIIQQDMPDCKREGP